MTRRHASRFLSRVRATGATLLRAATLLLLPAAFGVLTTASAAAPDKPVRVAFVYVEPVGDTGWSYQHEIARKEIERILGPAVKTTMVENVPATADAERVIRQLAAAGNDLIFTTSFGYMEPTLKVAKLFPKVRFGHATGFKTAPNVVTYESRVWEGAYLLGVLAGRTTKSNTLGYVGSFPIPEVIRNINAFTLGARSVNPKIRTRVIWVDTWYDPGKERQAAEALIAQGADFLCQNTDSPAVVQTAERKGVSACGWDSNMEKYGPKAQVAANTQNWTDYYVSEVRKVMDGSWTGNRQTVWGLKEKMVVVAPLNKSVPADLVKLFDERRQAIVEGKLHPFTGPIKDNAGAAKVAANVTMTPAELLAMNWFVDGVEGSVKK
jgi:simple sugar transport system substrate-binding protein